VSVLVVGVGNPDRGDDGVGPAVVDELARRAPAGVDLVAVLLPTRLWDAWQGRDDVVVVDAIRTGREAGAVVVERVAERRLARSGAAGTHGFGVADAIELARALERLPARVTLVGVEVAGFIPGSGLSPSVASAVQPAADAVVSCVEGSR
jgi:hydrogenase maturation protease